MINLLKETTQALRQHGKTWNDVDFITDGECEIPLEVFKIKANEKYDNGYGLQLVSNICIVGSNWWLERAEYDGSEWWEYKEKPERPNKYNADPIIIGHYSF